MALQRRLTRDTSSLHFPRNKVHGAAVTCCLVAPQSREPAFFSSQRHRSDAWLPSRGPGAAQIQDSPCVFTQQEGEGRAPFFSDISQRQHETPAVAFVWPELDTRPQADVTNTSLLPIMQTSLSAVILTPWRPDPRRHPTQLPASSVLT